MGLKYRDPITGEYVRYNFPLIKGEKGEKGEPGNGIHVGEEAPTDSNVALWFDPSTPVQVEQDTVNQLNSKMELLESKLNTTNSKMDFLENSITNINVDELIKEHGVTEGLQLALDTLCEVGKGQLLLNGIYEIERPLVLNRENKDLSTSIKIFGNATIRKANSFDGISLLRLERGFHDEDCIVFENINFDGVNRTINGIDTYKPHIPVDEYGTVMDDSHGSKYVCFNNCTFVNCYTGARLTSLSYNFNGCLFHSNNYGVKLGARANANTFTGCSIRTNIVGVELRQLDATIGTCSNSFYTCTIESNRNVGIASFNDQDTKIIGCYLENNGYAIDSRFPSFGNYRCHIYFGSFGGAGGHYIDGFFSTSDNDYALGGAYFLGVVQSKVKCLFDVIGDGTYLNTPLANVKISGKSTYKSSFKLGDGKQYVCLGNTTNIISMTDNYNTDSVTVDVTSSLTKNVTNISNLTKFKLCTIKLNQLYIGKLEFTAGITGKTAGGAPSSQGIIIQDLAVSNKYATHYIKGAGNPLLVTGVDGKRDTEKSNSIFGSSSGITIERVDSGTFDLYVTNLVNNALAGWGTYTRIELDIICHLRGTARGIANHMILS